MGAFRSLGVKRIDVLDVRVRAQAVLPSRESLDLIRGAEIVFLTGGDQRRLSRIFRGTPLHASMSQVLARGATIAGTSAGAVALAEVMHFTARATQTDALGVVATAPGLGIMHGVFVDSHFTQRQRLGRLFQVVTAEPSRVGIGLDEDTAVVAEMGALRVLGRGSVTILDGRPLVQNRRGGMHVHLLRGGDSFHLATGMPSFRSSAPAVGYANDRSVVESLGRLFRRSNS
jgi:cyanophycinase